MALSHYIETSSLIPMMHSDLLNSGNYPSSTQLSLTLGAGEIWRAEEHRGQTSKTLFLFIIAGISFTS